MMISSLLNHFSCYGLFVSSRVICIDLPHSVLYEYNQHSEYIMRYYSRVIYEDYSLKSKNCHKRNHFSVLIRDRCAFCDGNDAHFFSVFASDSPKFCILHFVLQQERATWGEQQLAIYPQIIKPKFHIIFSIISIHVIIGPSQS